MLSIIVPAFNEENVIDAFYLATSKILISLKCDIKDYEIIFVDDGSTDNTWHHIQDIIAQSNNAHAVKFSRNFGKEAAIFAGLHKAKGDCAIIMDCDLQHPPEYIEEMYKHYLNGYHIVRCVKNNVIRSLSSKLFAIPSFLSSSDCSIPHSLASPTHLISSS